MPRLAALILAALLASYPPASAQAWETNSGFGSLVLNGVDGHPPAAPNRVGVAIPGPIAFEIGASPLVPFVFLFAPGLDNAALVFGTEQLDLGPPASLLILLDGNHPGSPNDLAVTDAAGEATITAPIFPGFPPGLIGAFQAVTVDPAAPGGFAITAAAELTVTPANDFGAVRYSRGGITAFHELFEVTAGSGAPVATMLPAPIFRLDPLTLNRFPELYGESSPTGGLDRLRRPATRPVQASTNTGFSRIAIPGGDLYRFKDSSPGNTGSGFMIVDGATGRLRVPFSLTAQFGTNLRTRVAIDDGGTVMACGFDTQIIPPSDGVVLVNLDGSLFPNGREDFGVIPFNMFPGPSVSETSMTIAAGALYFRLTTAALPFGVLLRAPVDGTAQASMVTFPPLGTGGATPSPTDDLFVSPNGQEIFTRAGPSGGQDIYKITNITGAGETVINVTQLATSHTIAAFGDGYRGSAASFAVSPTGAKIAFLTGNTDRELWIADAVSPPALVHVSSNAVFDPSVDTFVDPNFWDDDNLLFFAGTASGAMDLYNFELSTGTLNNVTRTNQQDGSVLPIAGAPGATIDPEGYFTRPDRMIFVRSGNLAPGGPLVHNLVGVDYATLSAYDITGSEFSGVGTPDTTGVSDLVYAPAADVIWTSRRVTGTLDDHLFTFDPSSGSPAVQVSTATTGSFTDFTSLTPSPDGTRCLAEGRKQNVM